MQEREVKGGEREKRIGGEGRRRVGMGEILKTQGDIPLKKPNGRQETRRVLERTKEALREPMGMVRECRWYESLKEGYCKKGRMGQRENKMDVQVKLRFMKMA